MIWKALGIAFISCQMLTSTFGCNFDVLDSEAHIINTKLSLHHSISPNAIKDALRFVYDESVVGEQYKHPERFESLYERMMQEVEGSLSKKFVENCKLLYSAGDSNLKTKTSIHLLLEKVREKYLHLIKLIKMHEEQLNEEHGVISHADKDIFSTFFDGDVIVATKSH